MRRSANGKIVRTAGWLLCAVPLLAWADGSAFHASPRGRAVPAADRFGRPNPNDPLPDWDEVQPWMHDHCPNRLRALGSIRYPRRQEALKHFMTERYAHLKSVKLRDPELFELLQKQAELEDAVFGYEIELRTKPTQKEGTEKALRAKVVDLVHNNLDIRQRRVHKLADNIEQMKLALKRQSEQLEADKTKEAQLVENRFKFEMNKVGALHGPPGPVDANGTDHDATTTEPSE